MPEKYKVTRTTFSGYEGTRRSDSMSTLTYLPSCHLDPVIIAGVPVSESASHSAVPQTYVTESHWISGALGPKPKKLPFNYCHHLVSRLQIPNDGQLELKRLKTLVSTFDRLEGQCSFYHFVKNEQFTDEKITFRYGPALWLSLMGSGDTPLDWEPYLPINTSLFTSKTVELDGMALAAMVPKLDDGFSLPLFVAEILTVKSLVVNALKLLRNLPSAVLSLLRSGLPLSKLSNGWLEGVFGWLPLVRDIKTIVQKLFSTRDSVLKYLKGSGKRKTLHFKKGLSPQTFRDESWFEPQKVSASFDTRTNPYRAFSDIFKEIDLECSVTHDVHDLDFFATMEFEYRVPQAESLIAPIWGGLDYWGVNISPSDVWEYIPFSFVIDWFLSVGPMIARLDKTNLQVQVVIYNYCRSYKYLYTSEAKVDKLVLLQNWLGDDDTEGWTTPDRAEAKWQVRSYLRVPGVPVLTPTTLLELRLPKGMTLITAAALGDQQLRDRLIRLLSRGKRG